MKNMEYSEKRKLEILYEGKYRDYQFYILNLGTHPTAYIEIPRNSSLFGKEYDSINIEVHGGLTYSDDNLGDIKADSWFIGWDYAHYGDYMGYESKLPLNYRFDDNKKWTTEEIFEEVKEAIDQIMILEREEIENE